MSVLVNENIRKIPARYLARAFDRGPKGFGIFVRESFAMWNPSARDVIKDSKPCSLPRTGPIQTQNVGAIPDWVPRRIPAELLIHKSQGRANAGSKMHWKEREKAKGLLPIGLP